MCHVDKTQDGALPSHCTQALYRQAKAAICRYLAQGEQARALVHMALIEGHLLVFVID